MVPSGEQFGDEPLAIMVAFSGNVPEISLRWFNLEHIANFHNVVAERPKPPSADSVHLADVHAGYLRKQRIRKAFFSPRSL